jgi:hypothetical protein
MKKTKQKLIKIFFLELIPDKKKVQRDPADRPPLHGEPPLADRVGQLHDEHWSPPDRHGADAGPGPGGGRMAGDARHVPGTILFSSTNLHILSVFSKNSIFFNIFRRIFFV